MRFFAALRMTAGWASRLSGGREGRAAADKRRQSRRTPKVLGGFVVPWGQLVARPRAASWCESCRVKSVRTRRIGDEC
jgi:hypothetical protein